MKHALRAFALICVIVTVVAAVIVFGELHEPTDDRPPHADGPSPLAALYDQSGLQAAALRAYGDAVNVAVYLDALHQAEVAASFSSSGRGGTRCGDDFECFKACTLEHESGGVYEAVSRGGTYRGAWQFDQRTWDSNAEASGRPDLVGVSPDLASVEDQDLVAHDTWVRRGNQPWGGRC